MHMNVSPIIGSLKCDAPGCAYVSPDEIALTPDVIGRPCPTCGANLCTEADFRGMYAVRTAVSGINTLMRGLFGEPDPKDVSGYLVNYHDGALTIAPVREES